MRKRKVTYPVARTSRRPGGPGGGPDGQAFGRSGVTAIDLEARTGKTGIKVGSRVRIGNAGLYNGESAVVESLPSGVIPSAIVRTDQGRTRRVRTIDLELIVDEG